MEEFLKEYKFLSERLSINSGKIFYDFVKFKCKNPSIEIFQSADMELEEMIQAFNESFKRHARLLKTYESKSKPKIISKRIKTISDDLNSTKVIIEKPENNLVNKEERKAVKNYQPLEDIVDAEIEKFQQELKEKEINENKMD
jgi:hypothetical protein